MHLTLCITDSFVFCSGLTGSMPFSVAFVRVCLWWREWVRLRPTPQTTDPSTTSKSSGLKSSTNKTSFSGDEFRVGHHHPNTSFRYPFQSTNHLIWKFHNTSWVYSSACPIKWQKSRMPMQVPMGHWITEFAVLTPRQSILDQTLPKMTHSFDTLHSAYEWCVCIISRVQMHK